MFKNCILNAKYNEYVTKYDLDETDNTENEEKYICYTYLSQIQPERLERDTDLLEKICENKFKDKGIMGIAIALNTQLLTSKTDIDDILQIEGRGKFDIYVIAHENSMTPEKIIDNVLKNAGENFEFAEIIRYMNSQKIITKWEEIPNINIIFVGEKEQEVESVKKDDYIENVYRLDEEKLLRIANDNENSCELVLKYTDGFPFHKEPDEGQTYVVLCEAEKLIDIIKNEDGLIRTNIFDANVRAYQGDTDVNKEIVSTLKECPRNFVLYNNGITMVCNKLVPDGKTLRIRNLQIVNGCQTCNSIYKAYKEKTDLSKAKVIVKIIEAKGESVTQGIVRGTNRQNIVYKEAFETIRQFHKDLEDFIKCIETKGFCKIYYERRSKQYNSDSNIKPYQKVSFRMLIQSMVAMYMNKVEIAHRHESKLLTDYKDILFVEGQSFYPYYVAALLSSNLDIMMKKEKELGDLKNYKMHILFLIQELNMGASPSINDKAAIEEYCKEFLDVLATSKFEKMVLTAADKFRNLMKKWIDKKGENYRFSVKDNPEFTEFMLNELRGNTQISQSDSMYHGTVMTVTTDKYGNLFGFIKRKPNNIYFNELDNPDMNILYEGKEVSYKITGTGNQMRAINVRLA
ncbi:AIPR family protein [Clostridiaceae bacterium Marseille-Q4145]|nr:AIPR family protein [Clostridiaceae bacterium Marseille-Q4145]